MTRIDPPLPLDTPKGEAWAHFVIDRGQEHHFYWVVFLDSDGSCWTFENPDVRMQHNNTMGRPRKPIEWRKQWQVANHPRPQVQVGPDEESRSGHD